MDQEANRKRPSIFEEEKKRLIYFITDQAEENYKKFKKDPNMESIVLYAGDFRPLQNRNYQANDLELMLSSEIFTTVNYSVIFRNLLRIFDLDRISNDFESGSSLNLPTQHTKGLEKFKKDHPDSKMRSEYMFFELAPNENEDSMILRTRYLDPISKEPISEVWEALKHKKR